MALQRKGKEETVYATGKVFSQLLKAEDVWTLRSGGGGGFGTPLDRKLADIEDDVRNEYISLAAAREHYGAVIDAVTGRADAAASQALRAAMRAQGLPNDQPLTSAARAAAGGVKVTAPPPRLRLLPPKARAMQDEAQSSGLLAVRCCS